MMKKYQTMCEVSKECNLLCDTLVNSYGDEAAQPIRIVKPREYCNKLIVLIVAAICCGALRVYLDFSLPLVLTLFCLVLIQLSGFAPTQFFNSTFDNYQVTYYLYTEHNLRKLHQRLRKYQVTLGLFQREEEWRTLIEELQDTVKGLNGDLYTGVDIKHFYGEKHHYHIVKWNSLPHTPFDNVDTPSEYRIPHTATGYKSLVMQIAIRRYWQIGNYNYIDSDKIDETLVIKTSIPTFYPLH